MSDTLRTGVVGTGGWGTHIAEQFHQNPDADVVALTDVVEENRIEAGEKLASTRPTSTGTTNRCWTTSR